MLVFVTGRRIRKWSTAPYALNWALEDVSGQLNAPADLTPEKEPPVLIQYEAGGVPEPALALCPAKNLTPDGPANKPSQCTHNCHIPALS
jgi:hypothetical protein